MTKNEIKSTSENKKLIKRIGSWFVNLYESIITNWQVLVFSLIILVAIVFLVYALGFSTPWNQAEARSVLRNEVIDHVRPINIHLVEMTLILVVVVLVGLGLGSHNRKKYYWSNYVVMALILGLFVYTTYLFIDAHNTLRPLFYDSLYENTVHQDLWGRVFYDLHYIRPDSNPTIGRSLALEIGRVQLLDFLDLSLVVIGLGVLAIAGIIAITISKIVVLKEQNAQAKYRREMIAIADQKILERTDVVYNTSAPIAQAVSADLNLDIVNQIQADDLEVTKVDKMRYQTNKISYTLLLISLLTFLYALFTTINYTTGSGGYDDMRVRPDFQVAIFIAVGIIMMLTTFLASEKVKAYSLGWSYGVFLLSLVHLLSIITVPTRLFNKGELPRGEYTLVIVFYSISIILTVTAAIISIIKTRALRKHLKVLGEL